MIVFHLLTIFPHIVDSYINESLIKRAQQKRLILIKTHDIRKFAADKHKTIDDTPYGGGPGMVMKLNPIYKTLTALKLTTTKKKKCRIILLSPRGQTFTQNTARRLSRYKTIAFICGRYEGVDERVAKHIADESISIGDYILAGGELAALVMMETIARLIPGVVGKHESVTKSDFSQYTKPEIFYPKKSKKEVWRVPKVLLSGNHKKIKDWRGKRMNP